MSVPSSLLARMTMQVLLLIPVILLTAALLPSVLLLPLLTPAQGRRVLLFVDRLRAWNTEVLKSAPSGRPASADLR
jgi:hypothetical protein